MKIFILILAFVVYSAAGPLPDEGDEGNGLQGHEHLLVDLEEMGLEFFVNGTVRLSNAEDLLRLYDLRRNADDLAGGRTEEHFEQEEEDDDDEGGEQNGRDKRTIFADDERLPIPNSLLNSGRNPFCALAEVSNGCTAIFIGPNQALTAGRCVYDRFYRRFRTGLYLYRRRNCYQRGTYMSTTNLFTVNGYALSDRAEYDYGMIITSQRSPCWVSFGFTDLWNNRGLELLGYPYDKRSGCYYHPAYFSSCSTSNSTRDDLYLQHRCDAYSTTGAPLMSEFVDQPGLTRGMKGVVGVNVYSGAQYNYGPRINRDRFYQFIDWMQQTGYNATATVVTS